MPAPKGSREREEGEGGREGGGGSSDQDTAKQYREIPESESNGEETERRTFAAQQLGLSRHLVDDDVTVAVFIEKFENSLVPQSAHAELADGTLCPALGCRRRAAPHGTAKAFETAEHRALSRRRRAGREAAEFTAAPGSTLLTTRPRSARRRQRKCFICAEKRRFVRAGRNCAMQRSAHRGRRPRWRQCFRILIR